MARLREFLPNPSELALLLAARGLACVGAWQVGFRALSDDDYARITIAQRFTEAPHFDPSGTSWLPAPFWIYGAALRAFGTGLDVARATAIALGLGATVLLYVAARLLGASRPAAIVGAAFATLAIGYSALLGIAAVPEVPCAALIVLAVATSTRTEPMLRALGGLCLVAATLSRYEAWPVAAVFSAFGLWDSRRRPAMLASVAFALLGPGIWLLLGRFEHGDALFFVTRVAAYRRALGGASTSLAARLLEYPRLLLFEGVVVLPILAIAAFMEEQARRRILARANVRPAIALAALLAFLMLGSVTDGVPTHHAARVLLPIVFFGCLVLGNACLELPVARRRPVPSTIVLLVISFVPWQTGMLVEGDFARRAPELEAGQAAQSQARGELAIDTTDYGYFAVQAAFGLPRRTRVLDDHDPRRPQRSDALAGLAGDAVVTAAHAEQLAPRCAKLWNNAGFALMRCP